MSPWVGSSSAQRRTNRSATPNTGRGPSLTSKSLPAVTAGPQPARPGPICGFRPTGSWLATKYGDPMWGPGVTRGPSGRVGRGRPTGGHRWSAPGPPPPGRGRRPPGRGRRPPAPARPPPDPGRRPPWPGPAPPWPGPRPSWPAPPPPRPRCVSTGPDPGPRPPGPRRPRSDPGSPPPVTRGPGQHLHHADLTREQRLGLAVAGLGGLATDLGGPVAGLHLGLPRVHLVLPPIPPPLPAL